MSEHSDNIARLTALEVKFEHMDKQLEKMGKKVDEMHEVLLKARGAKWIIVGLAGLAGFVSGLIGKFWH